MIPSIVSCTPQKSNNLNITYATNAVPEPSSFAAIAALLALGFTATRRRRIK